MDIRTHLLCLVVFLGIGTPAPAQMTLDLDPRPGDQGKRDRAVKPGERITLDLVAVEGAAGLIGFEVELTFDQTRVRFEKFTPAGLMTGAMSMPPQQTPGSIKISAALMGRTSPGESGTLGHFVFETTPDLGAETRIELTAGAYGSSAGTRHFPIGEHILLRNKNAAPATGETPAGAPQAVDTLPASLKTVYTDLQNARRARIEAELRELGALRRALEKTGEHLKNAGKTDQKRIEQALQQLVPAPPEDAPPGNPEQRIRRLLEKTDRETRQLQEELKKM